MPAPTSPFEIARETLRLLASRRIVPTPDHYRTLYDKIAGNAPASEPAARENPLKTLTSVLPREAPEQLRLAHALEVACTEGGEAEYGRILSEFVSEQSRIRQLPWGDLINDLLREWASKRASLTPGKKREMLDRVLSSSASNSELLFTRLNGLLGAWAQNAQGTGEAALTGPVPEEAEEHGGEILLPSSSAAALLMDPSAELAPKLRELFSFTLEEAVASQLLELPDLIEETRRLARAIREADNPDALNHLLSDLKRLAYRLELLADERAELRAGLIHLLRLMLENIGELVMDDTWLYGQVETVREIIDKPLDPRAMDHAERCLKEIIFKQGQLKQSLIEAQNALKKMLSGFVDHLADFATNTMQYHDKIEICAKKISAADNISALENVLQDVMGEMRQIQDSAKHSHNELRAAQREIDEANRHISKLREELDHTSALVRHDQATGVLNRRGLEEILTKEVARSRRRSTPLCIALLDIDNFKKLNDSLGHAAGDAALVHLSGVVRTCLRPQDSIARYGGEEFVLVLPETGLQDGISVLVRLQRELTKKFFLHENQKLLITFSGGVTLLNETDTNESAIKRADAAMYRAKKEGKNRVYSG
ncbi:MAG: diguanylate cyclase [Betaproteobacteria bacterium]|nr:diguanylate cyclase [Betaproteobacteria bacterium]